ILTGVVPIDYLYRTWEMPLGDIPNPVRSVTKHHHFLTAQVAPPHSLLPQPPAKCLGLFERSHVTGTVGADLQSFRTFAVDTAVGVVTAANLQFTPAALVQVRKHTIHRDIQPAHLGCAERVYRRARRSLGVRLGGLLKQQRTKLLGGIAYAVGADMHQG